MTNVNSQKLLKSLRCYVKHACVRASYIYYEMFVCLVSAQRGTVQGGPGRALYVSWLGPAAYLMRGRGEPFVTGGAFFVKICY